MVVRFFLRLGLMQTQTYAKVLNAKFSVVFKKAEK
jgi:hypothetical protein